MERACVDPGEQVLRQRFGTSPPSSLTKATTPSTNDASGATVTEQMTPGVGALAAEQQRRRSPRDAMIR